MMMNNVTTSKNTKGKETKALHITMTYLFVGDTSIDVPMELLKGKTEEDQLKSAYKYAQEHIGEIPVARNTEYVYNSDKFELDDIDFDD